MFHERNICTLLQFLNHIPARTTIYFLHSISLFNQRSEGFLSVAASYIELGRDMLNTCIIATAI